MANEFNDMIGPSMGSRSGRLAPQNFAGVDGTFAFVFGSDVPGVFGELALGDSVELKQSVDFTTLTLLELRFKFRQPLNPAVAAVYTAGAMTFPTGYAGGETLNLTIDSGAPQVITFLVADQSQQAALDRINATLTGALASVDAVTNQFVVTSGTTGATSKVDVTGGTGLGPIGFYVGFEEGVDFLYKFSVLVGVTTLVTLFPDKGASDEFVKRTVRVDQFAGANDLIFKLETGSL